MAKIRKIYDQTIKPDGSKTTIYPITSTRAVYTPEGETLDSYLKDGYFHGADLAGYKVVYELSELPLEETPFGYLMDSNLYVWVGTNGDTLDGKYQNCGPFKGPKGDTGQDGQNGQDGHDGMAGLQGIQGPQGPAGLTGPKGNKGDKGDSGVDLGQVVLSTSKAETTTGKALDASVAQYKIGFTDEESEIEDVPSNYYKRTEVDALIDAQRIEREQKELEQDTEIASFENTINDVVENYKPIVINGNVTNAPDEEDITSKDGLLKLKDRPNMNGMGYYILRWDKSFAEQVTKENTIYEIRYDFDLRESFEGLKLISEFDYGGIIYYSNEEPIAIRANQTIWVPDDCVILNGAKDTLLSINSSYTPTADENVFIACTRSKTIGYALNGIVTIPVNCVLKFEGGSLSRGTLNGNRTTIEAGVVKIFDISVILAGTWNVADAYPEWFGIIANDNNADLSLVMPQLNSLNATVRFGKGIYNTLNPVKLIDVEGVSPKDTIISMKKSGTGLYTAYVGDITVPSSSSVRENWFLRNLAIVIDAPTEQDDIISSCALLVGNSGSSNIENCLITTYYYNIKATETFTEQQRIEAAKNDDKTLENSANSGVRFRGYVDGLVVKDTVFGGQIGIYQEEDSILDTDTFINCYTLGSPRGYAGIIFNGSVSSITFQQLSINQDMFGIKAYKNFNGITINGGRSEQSIVLKDPDDNKVLGGFLYVNKTDNDIIAATILSYYMDSNVNGIYLKNGSGRINVGIYNLYNRDNYEADLKYALYASSSNLASVINTKNATFPIAPVILENLIISEGDYADIGSSKYILISNCIIRSERYEAGGEYKSYQYDGNRIFAPFITRGSALPIRLTKRLKDISGLNSCRLKGIASLYNSASVSGYYKTIDFDILIDKNGTIIKEEKINDTENDMSVSVDTDTCIVTLTFTTLTDIIGECIFYKSTYA